MASTKIQDCFFLRTQAAYQQICETGTLRVVALLLPWLLPFFEWSELRAVHHALAFHQCEGRKAAGNWTAELPPAIRVHARLRSPTLLAKLSCKGGWESDWLWRVC